MRLSSARAVRVKVATAVGLAAFIGMASLAAASPSEPTTGEPTVEPAPTDPVAVTPDEPATVPSPEVAHEPETDAPAAGDNADDVADPPHEAPQPCLTHGRRVSEIAHATPPGPGHGAAVSAAAHDHEGECVHGDDAEPSEEPSTEPADAVRPTAAPAVPAATPVIEHGGPSRSARQGGHGNGHLHGND